MRGAPLTIAAATVGMILFAAAVTAQHRGHDHSHAAGVVKERMEVMTAMAKSQKAIARRIKANRELESIKDDAGSIQTLAGKIVSLFPPGSTDHPSEVKPAIWQNWADFERKAHVTEAESAKLAGTDPRDAKALAAQARALSQACGACHELYRRKH